jgi:hypothetical protein
MPFVVFWFLLVTQCDFESNILWTSLLGSCVQEYTISAVSDTGFRFIQAAVFIKIAQLLSLVCSSFVHTAQMWNRPDHDQQHCYHHAPTVKPEAATAVAPDDGHEDARNMLSCT